MRWCTVEDAKSDLSSQLAMSISRSKTSCNDKIDQKKCCGFSAAWLSLLLRELIRIFHQSACYDKNDARTFVTAQRCCPPLNFRSGIGLGQRDVVHHLSLFAAEYSKVSHCS